MKALLALLLFTYASGCGPQADSISKIGGGRGSPGVRWGEGRGPEPIFLSQTRGGPTEARVWWPQPARPLAGVVFVTGIDGGFLEPVDGIYSRLAGRLAQEGVASIFVKYREPGDVADSVDDAIAGAQHLLLAGVVRLAIVGWSFGGTVVVHSGVEVPEIVTVVGIAPQSRGTEVVSGFRSQSLLLLHSKEDENVPYSASLDILNEAPASLRKTLISFEEGDHHLSGMAEKIDPILTSWLKQELLGN